MEKNYIVMDLEWNQCPDGKDGSLEELPFEIVEIGAVRLNEKLEECGEFHKLIRPRVYLQMHYVISEVTHLDMKELLHEGEEFAEAATAFIEWCGRDAVFCTWGNMDMTELQRNMAYYQIPNPYERPLLYYDIQKLYSRLKEDGRMRSSLELAVEQLEIPEDRPFHRALDDAHYTGLVMKYMGFPSVLEYRSMDYYRPPQTAEEEVYLVFPDYSKYVSRVFNSKEEAIADKTVADLVCCRCRRMLRKKIRWFPFNQRFYFALGICPEHGCLKGKIRMKRTGDGRVFAVKTMKLIGEDAAKQLYEKKEEVRMKRNQRTKLRYQSKKKDV